MIVSKGWRSAINFGKNKNYAIEKIQQMFICADEIRYFKGAYFEKN
jgi:hypothetical protein